jgi:hypothetical protein
LHFYAFYKKQEIHLLLELTFCSQALRKKHSFAM